MKRKIRITKQFNFETAHALYGYDGLCKNVHGHSYKLYVTVIGNPIDDPNHKKNGMLIDFSDLKKIVKKKIVSVLDHSTFLWGLRGFADDKKKNDKSMTISSVAEFDDDSNVVDFLEFLKQKRDKELN